MKEKYTVKTSCNNCGVLDTMDIDRGTRVTDEYCSTCGCQDLKSFNH